MGAPATKKHADEDDGMPRGPHKVYSSGLTPSSDPEFVHVNEKGRSAAYRLALASPCLKKKRSHCATNAVSPAVGFEE